MNTETWYLIINALAVFRLTRLFARDSITAWLRNADIDLPYVTFSPGVLLNCEWCLSVWFGALAVGLTEVWFGWRYVAAALAFSAVAGIISERT